MTRDYWRRREKRGQLYDLTLWRGLLAIAVLLLIAGFLGFCAQLAHGQRDNTHYAAQYSGATVAAKVTAAQADCTPLIPCTIIIDSTLSPALEGTLPTPCAQCLWKDYRIAGSERCASNASPSLAACAVSGAAVSKKPWVDVLRDCIGIVGDGVTDDGAALQTCINNNCGRTIFFPDTAASTSGGGCTTSPSYYSTQRLALCGNGQRLLGSEGAVWCGGPRINFAASTSGILIPANCYGCGVEHLELQSADLHTNTGSIGIEIRGGMAHLEYVNVEQFGGDGIWVNGNGGLGYLPDHWFMSNVLAYGNYANGIETSGSDANQGTCLRCDVRVNAQVNTFYQIYDHSSFGSTWVAPHGVPGAGGTAYKGAASSNGNWIGPYFEGGTKSSFSAGNIVWGGNLGYDATTGTPQVYNVSNGAGAGLGTQTYLEVWNQQDAASPVALRSGATVDKDMELKYETFNGLGKWAVRRQASDNTFRLVAYGGINPSVLSCDPTTYICTFWTGIAGAGVAFASLGTPANGTMIYCNDCTIANPCAAAGTGAFAKRLNGVWVCN